jgi:hypothetical protein
MIVKDVDMDESGNKTYVFGMDERTKVLISALKACLEFFEASATCWEDTQVAQGGLRAIAKYEGKDEPLNSH